MSKPTQKKEKEESSWESGPDPANFTAPANFPFRDDVDLKKAGVLPQHAPPPSGQQQPAASGAAASATKSPAKPSPSKSSPAAAKK